MNNSLDSSKLDKNSCFHQSCFPTNFDKITIFDNWKMIFRMCLNIFVKFTNICLFKMTFKMHIVVGSSPTQANSSLLSTDSVFEANDPRQFYLVNIYDLLIIRLDTMRFYIEWHNSTPKIPTQVDNRQQRHGAFSLKYRSKTQIL